MRILLTKNLHDPDDNKGIIILYLFTLLVTLLGTYKSISSVYMPDDYLLSSTQMPISFYLNQGRFVQAIATFWFNFSDVNIISSSAFFTPIFILLIAGSASCFVYFLSEKKISTITGCLLSGVIACHPAFSMMAVYHLSTIFFSICAACFCIYMYIYDNIYTNNQKRKSNYITLPFLVFIVCGTYQPFFIALIIFTSTHILVKSDFLLKKSDIKKTYPIICGFILYVIVYKLTKNLAGYNDWDNRASLVTDLNGRIHDLFHFLPSLFFKDWWLIPWQYSCVLSFTMLLSILTFISNEKNKKLCSRFIESIFVFGIVILPISILKDWDPTSRAMFAVSFSYVVVFLVFFSKRCNILKCIAMGLVIFLGLISSNNYLYKVEMDQKSDQAMVNIVYAMLNTIDLSGKSIYIVNNDSIKVAPWAINGIFYFNTGVNFNLLNPSDSDEQKCKFQKIKPSILNENEKVIICLN